MADSSKPSWRRGRSDAGRGNAAAGKGWQSRQTKASQSAVSKHRAKLLALGVLVLALAAYFLATVFFIPVKTPLLVIAATLYPFPHIPNGYAQEDAVRLAATNPGNIESVQLGTTKITRASLDQYLDQLSVRAGGPSKDVVLLYISAHGAIDDLGDPCLLLSDSSPTDATTWFKVGEIWERLKHQSKTKFVLLLDAGRIQDEWRLGILYNGFAEQLEQQLKANPLPHVHVILASSGGEKTWTAPELGGSVFGHYAAKALSDGASANDDLITLRELADYLHGTVSSWVTQNRASQQTPRLLTSLPPERDFAIAYRGKASSSANAGANKADRQRIKTDWEAVHRNWRLFQQRFDERKLVRYEPLVVGQAESLLLRMEQLLLAGTAYRADFDAAQTKVQTLLETDPPSRLPGELSGFSSVLHGRLNPHVVGEPSRQTEMAKWIEARGQPKRKEGEPLPQFDYDSAAFVATQFVRQLDSPSRSQIHDALSLLNNRQRHSSKGNRIVDVSEVLFLRMVDAYVDRPSGAEDFNAATQRYLQQVLAAREQAEQAAAPDDERVHFWIQPLVDAADAQRRVAEDQLFCDSVSASKESPMPSSVSDPFSFTAGYVAAAERNRLVAKAYALRDDIWHGSPHLGKWLLHAEAKTRQRVMVDEGSLAAAMTFLQQLAAQNHELAATLDKLLTDDQLDSPTLQAAVDKVQSLWSKLREGFVAHCQELKDRAGLDKPTLREIGEALQVPTPLLSADERVRLAAKYQDILFAEAILPGETNSRGKALRPVADRTTAGSETRAERELQVPAPVSVLATSQHPAVSLLDRTQLPLLLNLRSPEPEAVRKEESDIVALAKRGARIRRWLADIHQAAKDLEDVTNRRLAESTETAANIRAGISEADRLVRAATALVADDFPDPARRLRRVDLHLELLWHARRALDDFWGITPGIESDLGSYFAAVADEYLQAARRLEETPKTLAHQREDLAQLLAARRVAIAGTGVHPQNVQTLWESPEVEESVHIAWHKDLPAPGVAAMWLEGTDRDSRINLIQVRDKESRTWRRHPLSLGKSAAVDVVQFVPAEQLTAGKSDHQLTANVLYRGNQIRRPFEISGPKAVLNVELTPQLPRTAKVTVRGEANRRAYILFVFDCSDSMNEEGRLGRAVTGLTRVLDALRGDEHYQVGLYAYGHRARFGAGNLPVGPNGAPVNVNPDRDVELLIPANPLTDEQCTGLKRRLNELKAVGVTPLYYAIRTAVQSEEFQLARPEDIKRVIVISDGIDYQFQERTTAESVKQVLRQNPKVADIRVDVVLFDKNALLKDSQAQQIVLQRGTTLDQELKDIQSVATSTGGELFSAENPDQLTEALRRALKLVKYSVTRADAPPTSEADRIDLERDWPLLDLPSQPQKFLVQLHGAARSAEQTITIEGGEAIELRFDKAEEQLVFPAYGRRDAREPIDDLPDSGTQERYRILPILPHKYLNKVTFQVAVQNRDRLKFTARPQHAWAEIQPLSDAEQSMGSTYHFYDAQFVPSTPVPVLQFVVPDWPAGATNASLQLWLKFDFPPLKPNGSAAIEELQTVVVDEDIPQASFRADIKQLSGIWRVTVWEDHEPGSKLFTARVQSTPLAARVQHQYFVGVDKVKHLFDYKAKPAPTVIVTARDRITQGAISVPRVVIPVKE